jgi:hypothetical protein
MKIYPALVAIMLMFLMEFLGSCGIEYFIQ